MVLWRSSFEQLLGRYGFMSKWFLNQAPCSFLAKQTRAGHAVDRRGPGPLLRYQNLGSGWRQQACCLTLLVRVAIS